MSENSSPINLSVFFPSYNEEGNIAATVENARRVLRSLKLRYEILIVDDGSNDRTGEIAEVLARKYPEVKVFHKQNGGYGTALRAGFEKSGYDWIVYTDADGQFDLAEINKFLEKAQAADYIIGYRIKRQDPLYRLIFARLWAFSVFLLFGIWVKDLDCGFKMIHKRVLRKIPALTSTRGAMINAELLIKAKRAGFKIVQVGVNHYPRKAGQPTGASIRVIFKSYLELFKLWFKLI